jgi:hypothetical protein
MHFLWVGRRPQASSCTLHAKGKKQKAKGGRRGAKYRSYLEFAIGGLEIGIGDFDQGRVGGL